MDELYLAIFVSVSVLVMSTMYIKWFVKPGGPPLPPGPAGLPVVGYLPFLGDDLLQDLKDLELKYGPIYKLNLGQKMKIVISSPSLAKEVLRDQDAAFVERESSVAVRVGTFGGNDMTGTPHSPQWLAMRKVFVREVGSSKSWDDSYHLGKEVVGNVIKHVYSETGKAVDIGQLCESSLLKFLWKRSLGGIDVGESTEAEFRSVLAKIRELFGKPNISDLYPCLARLDIQGVEKEMQGYVQRLDSILDTVIAQHKNNNVGRHNFLQVLLELNENGDSDKHSISEKQVRGALMNSIATAQETAVALEWAMAELMNNPTVMANTQKELSEVVGLNNAVEHVHISKLSYLAAVVKEALRLHPPIPILVPMPPSDRSSVVGGYTIPNYTSVYINVWSMQRDPSLWDNPTQFKPERFLDHHEIGNWDFQYLPFGAGRRMCAGRALAERITLFWLASLVHSFDWKLPHADEKLDMSATYGQLLTKSTPLLAIPKPRTSKLYL